jgi:hypothetical protein
MNAPVIQSLGAPPDRHAERIVDEMLTWLHTRQREIWPRAKGSLRTQQMGNPTGQARAVERMRKAMGDLVLELKLNPGKRGRYELYMVNWVVVDTLRNKIADLMEPPPALSALALTLAMSDRAQEWRSSVPLIVTRHAIIRLAQRAEMRTVEDLYKALRMLWWALYDLVIKDVASGRSPDNATWCEPPDCGWRLRLDNGAIAVVGRDEDGARRMIVKTILEGDAP